MDDCRFDGLARVAATGGSRRGAVKAFLGGGVAALAASLDQASSGARGCKRLGGKCDSRSECCNGAACNRIHGCNTGGRRCCSNRGSSCTRSCDCCLSLDCVNGRCG